MASCTLAGGKFEKDSVTSKLRKPPVIVDAERYDDLHPLAMQTFEGPIAASHDWIVPGITGEKYPCKPEIYRESYAPAEPDAGSVA
ncbi:MAG: hypothetical protein DLM68_09385 [Hyphomicrobiales bacterium]|nr:MAG: hypothetical protein DLM68_09385 [Hyphomicrobiales bacterium]